jgi:hypothetical protein
MEEALTVAPQCVKLAYEGEMVDAEEVPFAVKEEVHGVYALEGGMQIELRHEVKKVYRLVDKQREDGSPVYIVAGGTILITTPPRDGGVS